MLTKGFCRAPVDAGEKELLDVGADVVGVVHLVDEPEMLPRVLDALEPLPAEATPVRGRVGVLHHVLSVPGARAKPAQCKHNLRIGPFF